MAPDDMTRVCDESGVLIRVALEMKRKLFEMGIFSLLRLMNCNPILALVTIAQLAVFDLDVNGVQWFPSDYKQSRFNFIPLVPGVSRKRAHGTEVTQGGHHKVHSIYHEQFADHGTSCLYTAQTWQLLLKKGG